MPKGPQRQKRPADVIGNAVHIAQIAAGETALKQPARRIRGCAGTNARVENTALEERSETVRKTAAARWG